jgi:catechol 2,3-dioxygenase-like lactoylglutathione lyase family enzyme
MLSDAHVEATIPVLDLKVSRRFYEGPLGLQPIESIAPEVEVVYQCRDASRILIYEHTLMIPSAHTVAHFIVDDVRATVNELRSRGVKFDEYDLPELKTVDGVAKVRGVDFAWFKDPDRNIMGIHN